MINLHERMGPGRDQTRDSSICSQTRICCQTRYRLPYAARYMDLVTRKPVFDVFDQVMFKAACSAKETSYNIEILLVASLDIMLFRKLITKALIRLHGCAGRSATLLFISIKVRFSGVAAHKIRVFFYSAVFSLFLVKIQIESTFTLCMPHNFSCLCCRLMIFYQNKLFQAILSGTLS